jgi:hypothetical protein
MDRVTRTDVKNILQSAAAYVLEKSLALIYCVSKHSCNCKLFRNVCNFKIIKTLIILPDEQQCACNCSLVPLLRS